MRQILHISDIHFGPKHLVDRAEGVLRLAERLAPDFIALSGDLTQRAKPSEFQRARTFVDRLPAPVVAVPGNHDVPLYRVWERVFAPYGAYRRHFDRETEPTWQDDELFVVGLNTAYGWTLTEGRLTLAQLRRLEERLEAAPAEAFKLVIAHHHLIPPPRFKTQSVLIHAFEAIEILAQQGADLVVSGHHHITYLGSSEQYYPQGLHPVVVLHSGTTTSSRGRGHETGHNSCNWIRVDQRSLEITNLRWDIDRGEFRPVAHHRLPRRGHELEPAPLPESAEAGSGSGVEVGLQGIGRPNR